MNLSLLPELISLFPLGWAFTLLWRERKQFGSLRLILFAVALLFVARFSAMLIQHPSVYLATWIGITLVSLNMILDAVQDFTDPAGVLFLVIGFVQTIKFEHKEEQTIQQLELLLPICSNCKQYRTPENVWMPIEHYLKNSGAPTLTHGICPECAVKLYGNAISSVQ